MEILKETIWIKTLLAYFIFLIMSLSFHFYFDNGKHQELCNECFYIQQI
ncbi:hypothetical protein ECOK1357_2801 [Escherichia coli OK1357]|nr:hypothetical protein ECOK1357_2801 [Escherichia coli OK1357]